MHPSNPEIDRLEREIRATEAAIALLRQLQGNARIITLLEAQLPTQRKQLKWEQLTSL